METRAPQLQGNFYGSEVSNWLVAIRATDESDTVPNMWLVYGFDSEEEHAAFYRRAKERLQYNAVRSFRQNP